MSNRLWVLAGLPLLGLAVSSSPPAPAGGRTVSFIPQGLAAPADTGQFPLRYCTALPRADFAHWDADYAQYERFLTPQLRRTQVGIGFAKNGVRYWLCVPAATAHAQLDTLTRVADPQLLQGHWRSVLTRTVVYCDSAELGERRIYRDVQPQGASTVAYDLTLADGQCTLVGPPAAGATPKQLLRKKYDLISGRYLLLYGLLKAAGGISQVGLDAQGRLLLHSYAVTERKIPGQYQTYETVLRQQIFERVP